MQFAPRAINFAYYAGIMLDALAHLQTSQLGSRPGRENASNYFNAAVKPCRAHAHTIF